MKRKYARLGMFLLSVMWVGSNLLLGAQFVVTSSPTQAFSNSQAAQLDTVTPTPTPPSGFFLDSTIIAAIIGAVAVVVAAIIGGAFIVYQVQKNHKLEIERLHQQSQSELALERQRHEAELQKMRYGERLNAEREEQERERQRRAAANATTLATASESANRYTESRSMPMPISHNYRSWT